MFMFILILSNSVKPPVAFLAKVLVRSVIRCNSFLSFKFKPGTSTLPFSPSLEVLVIDLFFLRSCISDSISPLMLLNVSALSYLFLYLFLTNSGMFISFPSITIVLSKRVMNNPFSKTISGCLKNANNVSPASMSSLVDRFTPDVFNFSYIGLSLSGINKSVSCSKTFICFVSTPLFFLLQFPKTFNSFLTYSLKLK